MTTGGAGPLVPTFHGFVHNSMDGLILFEACLSGKLHHVPRRPHDRERTSLIKSGSIFIYEENASGIKRWTDGVAWSPSRILGNFLIYRELEKPFPPGEKKRAMKRKRSNIPGEPYPRRASVQETTDIAHHPLTPPTPSVNGDAKGGLPSNDQEKDLERSLIGSLVDSYGFRSDGLVKKTMSIAINGISHHMVSYYKVEDVKNNHLPRPLSDPRLANITVRPELYMKQNFRAPVEDNENFAVDGQIHPQMMYGSMNGAYNMRPGQYFTNQPYNHVYNMPNSGAPMYAGATSTSWPATPTTGAMAYASHPAYAQQPYSNPYYKDAPQSATSVKSEEQQHHPSTPSINGYANQYASQYPRENVHPNGMVHSNYSTPVQQSSATFNSMSAPVGRPPYSTPNINGASSQAHHIYGTSQSGQQLAQGQYAVRSPSQQYPMGSGPNSATAQSPHTHVKSPSSATHPNNGVHALSHDHSHNQQMLYHRSNSYGVPHTPQATGHSAADINGLGISSNGGYGQTYGSAGQAFRPVVEAGGQSGQHYGQ